MTATPLYGIEEEVFILEPDRPTPRSLYYLARLLWRDPRRYYTHSASNFSRGRDLRYGLMSGVEISTGKHDSIRGLVQDLAERRRDLAGVSQGLLCAVGNLPDTAEPTNTCGMHLHVSGVDRQIAYRRLVRYLAVFALALAHAPYAEGRRFGQSYRWINSYSLGPLRADPAYRFQDLIWSRRLGTLEVRVFDPSPDLGRVAAVLECLHRLLALPGGYTPADHQAEEPARARYNSMRQHLARLRSCHPDRHRPGVPCAGGTGEDPDPSHAGREATVAGGHTTDSYLETLVRELEELTGFAPDWLAHTPADATAALLEEKGRRETYLTLDAVYRRWAGASPWDGRQIPLLLGAVGGLLGYYLPRLPYTIWKAWREWC